MLIFKKITYRNFLSTGNIENVIDLNKHTSTLITGKNGEGKSTILCALTFVLFGRPFRNISKGQLINSINKKGCWVSIDFAINGHEYTVNRGIKPNVFQIYCDGQLLNQDAAIKDYQKVLEQQILKLNYKTFTQVVILGSATFVPFMQLPATQRREVIEDILDIKVFSLMNVILKDRSIQVRDEITRVEQQISNQQSKIQTQKRLIGALEQSRRDVVASLQQKIETNSNAIRAAEQSITILNTEIQELSGAQTQHDKVSDAIKQASQIKVRTSIQITDCEHNIDFFGTNETCPTCAQHIPDEYKHKALADLDIKLDAHRSKLDEITQMVEKLNKRLESAGKILETIRDKSIEIGTHRNTINILEDQNNELRSEIGGSDREGVNVTEEKAKMREYAMEAISFVDKKATLLESKQLHDVAAALLKDTGIKTAIIREYLPVMNKLINKYLGAMDFFVKFELDESFQEVIKSRARDVFTYDSFSEGEKRRIDLAILFTWRQIAKMKNSVNTNLLILDEILDGALDSGGIDYFLGIMNQFDDNTNIFVISHKIHQMIDRFDHVIRVEKKNDFSVIAFNG